MKALTIRQPWCWLILHGGKDIENRTWPTRYRGSFLIHAAQGMTQDEWGDAWAFAHGSGASAKAVDAGITRENIQRGGIVGIADLIDCVPPERRASRWQIPGCHGFSLANVRPLPFVPCRGALGFWQVPNNVLTLAGVRE